MSTQPCLSLSLPVYRCAYPATCLTLVRLPACLPSHVSLSLPVYQCVYPTTCLSLCPSIILSPSFPLSSPGSPCPETGCPWTARAARRPSPPDWPAPGAAAAPQAPLCWQTCSTSVRCNTSAMHQNVSPFHAQTTLGWVSHHAKKHFDSFLHIMHKGIYLNPPPPHAPQNKQTNKTFPPPSMPNPMQRPPRSIFCLDAYTFNAE